MDAQPVVYVNVDVAFLVNWVTDLAWLWATASLAGLRVRLARLAAAAAGGAALAVWAYFPGGRWLTSLPGALFGTALLLALAFLPCRLQQGLRAVAYFLLSGGAMAGAVLLAGSRQSATLPLGSRPSSIPGTVVAAGLLLSLVGSRYLWQAARDRSRLSRSIHGLRIAVAGRALELPALLDTGNDLREPLTGAACAVVEAAAMAELLPPEVLRAATAGWEALDSLPQAWALCCRLVPYRAVGRQSGLLLAFAPDHLAIRVPGADRWRRCGGLIGLSPEPLHPDGTYRALLPSAMLDGAIPWEVETG